MEKKKICRCGRQYSSLTVNCLSCNEPTPWASAYSRLVNATPNIGLDFMDSTGVRHRCVQLVENGIAIAFCEFEGGTPVRVGLLEENTSEQVVSICSKHKGSEYEDVSKTASTA